MPDGHQHTPAFLERPGDALLHTIEGKCHLADFERSADFQRRYCDILAEFFHCAG